MGSYNLKVYEYATGIQLRLYNQALIYSENNPSVPLLSQINEADEKVHTCELCSRKKHGKSHNFPRACFPCASMVKMHNFQFF